MWCLTLVQLTCGCPPKAAHPFPLPVVSADMHAFNPNIDVNHAYLRMHTKALHFKSAQSPLPDFGIRIRKIIIFFFKMDFHANKLNLSFPFLSISPDKRYFMFLEF